MRHFFVLVAVAVLAGAASSIVLAQVGGPAVAPPIAGSQDMPLLPGTSGGGQAAPQPGAPGPAAAPGTAPAAAPAAPQPIETKLPPPDVGENKIVYDQAYRALRNRDWARAVKLFERLASLQPEISEYRLNYALCLYEIGKLNEAREIYDRILASEPDNIQALLATARICCRNAKGEANATKKQDALDSAREALRRAARYGLAALRTIKNYPEFDEFKSDVMLQLDLIREPQSVRVETSGLRDPFYNPLPTKYDTAAIPIGDQGAARDRLTGKEQEGLLKRLEVLFAEIDPLVERNDFQALGKKWGEIDEIIRQGDKITSIELGPKFKELMKKHREKLPVIRSLLLRSYYTEGERMIDGMKVEYEKQDHQRVTEIWQRLEAHAKKMVTTDEKFAQPAADLLSKGKAIYEKAMMLKEIEQIKLSVTAIVTGGGVSQGIVNNRILSEGDIVYDAGGNPIPDLRVLQIKRRRIRFEYKGLAFEPRNQLATR